MFSSDDDGHLALVLGLVSGLIALLVFLVIALVLPAGSLQTADTRPIQAIVHTAAPLAATAPVATSLDTQLAADAAGVEVENGIVRIYFAPGRKDLAQGMSEALAGIVQRAASDGKLVVSGFHDDTGDAASNSLLARQRAVAVRDQLTRMGVPARQIELKKSTGLSGDSDAQARRVEVRLQ